MSAPPNEHVETDVPGLPRGLLELRDGYRFRPENLLLPSLLDRPARHVVDLGAGSGVLGLLAALRTPRAVRCTLVERYPALAELARANAARYRQDLTLDVLEHDLRSIEALPRGVDLVVTNPPFFPPGAGRESSNDTVRHATHALYGGLAEFVATASALLGSDGQLAVVYPADQLADVLAHAAAHGLAPARILLVHARHTGRPFRAWTLLEPSPRAPCEVIACTARTRR